VTVVRVQPSADVDDSAVLGAGTTVWHLAQIRVCSRDACTANRLGGPRRGPSGGLRFRQVALPAIRRSLYRRGRRALDDAESGMSHPDARRSRPPLAGGQLISSLAGAGRY